MITFILGIIIVVLIATIINIIEDNKRLKIPKISFKESLDLSGFPIITFISNNKKLNFILDTGSENSVINTKDLEGTNFTSLANESNAYGIEGNPIKKKANNLILNYKDLTFNYVFWSLDLTKPIEIVKKNSGITIHGLLGSDFFSEFEYIIDFKKLEAYPTKF